MVKRRPIPRLAAALLCLCAGGAAVAQGTDAGSLDAARTTLDKWVDTQRLISKEKEQWREQKDVLEQRIDLLSSEIAALRTKIAETEGEIAETRRERAGLDAENAELRDATERLAAAIRPLEERTLSIVARLPEPLRDRVSPLSQRIPSKPEAATTVSLGQRYQNVIGVLNEVNKFNGTVTVTNEVRTMPDGSTAEVRAVYVGLGQAYYVTGGRDAAGIGRPGADGWQWTPADEIAGDVALVLDMLDTDEVPGYVSLPATVK